MTPLHFVFYSVAEAIFYSIEMCNTGGTEIHKNNRLIFGTKGRMLSILKSP